MRKQYGVVEVDDVTHATRGSLQCLTHGVADYRWYRDRTDVRGDSARAQRGRPAGQPFALQQAQHLLERLETADLAQGLGQNVFRLHPALTATCERAPRMRREQRSRRLGNVLEVAH